MSSSSPKIPSEQGKHQTSRASRDALEATYRYQMKREIFQHIRRDNYCIGYVVARVADKMPLDLLEQLVDDLEAMNGRRPRDS